MANESKGAELSLLEQSENRRKKMQQESGKEDMQDVAHHLNNDNCQTRSGCIAMPIDGAD